MKAIAGLLFVSLIASMACKTENMINEPESPMPETPASVAATHKISIKVAAKTFTATLADNPAANAFKALLPLTLTMNELNNNEKYAQLSKSLPANASVPASIQSGDLMLYGSNTLVIFYKGFSTSYSYTKIGKVDDVAGLITALGTDDVKVSFELQKE